MAKVSVIMPAYDCEAHVRAAVDSVLAQTVADLELIVVDDGSRDRTAAEVAVAAAQDPRVRLVRRRHAGIPASLNAALAVARGRFVARLDADDLWLPRFLEVTCAILDARPDVDVAYARARAMTADGRPLLAERGLPLPFPDDAFASMLVRDCTVNVALLARREAIERAGGYDESFRANEDWDLWLRVSRGSRFAFVDQVLARYRMRPGSVTRLAPARTAAERLRVLDKAFAAPAPSPRALGVRELAYRNVFFQLGLARWHEHDVAGAALAFADGIRASDRTLHSIGRVGYELFLHHFGDRRLVLRLRAVASRVRRRLHQRKIFARHRRD